MNYIILESQTTGTTTAVLTAVKHDYFAAEAAYHEKLAYAASSAVELHAVTLLGENGKEIKHECYDHRPPATEEPAAEGERGVFTAGL